MNKDVMNQGVQIILDRMDTNPEEFEEGSYSKWGDIVQAVHARVSSPEAHKKNAPLPFLSDAEVKAMYDKLEDVRRENFTADVLRRLANVANLDVQEDLFDSRSYSTSNIPLGGGALTSTTGAVGTWGKSTVTLAEVQALSEEQKQDILDLIEAQNKRKKKATAR
jgi:hypothetical protein